MSLNRRSMAVRLFVSHMLVALLTVAMVGVVLSYLIQNYYYGVREWQGHDSARRVAKVVRRALSDGDLSLVGRRDIAELVDNLSESTDMEIGILAADGVELVRSSNIYRYDLRLDPTEVEAVLRGNKVTRKVKGPDHNYLVMAFPVVQASGSAAGVRVDSATSSEETVLGAVVMQASLENSAETIDRILELILYSMLAALLASLCIALVLARRVTGPLVRLRDGARALGEGTYREIAVPEGCTEETEDLVRAFNFAVGRVRETFAERKRLDEARRHFVNDVSHELRAPLTSIRGFLELMLDGETRTEKVRKYCTIMSADAAYLERLALDLLTLGRIESQFGKEEPASSDLPAVVARVVGTIGQTAAAKGVSLQTELGTDITTVRMADHLLYRALLNYVDNAVSHSAPGGTVRITARWLPREGVEVLVEDHGPGIPPEDRRRIWERFQKADTARTRGTKSGSGLGLAIVKAIVEGAGGRCFLRDTPNGGATFGFVVPSQANSR